MKTRRLEDQPARGTAKVDLWTPASSTATAGQAPVHRGGRQAQLHRRHPPLAALAHRRQQPDHGGAGLRRLPGEARLGSDPRPQALGLRLRLRRHLRPAPSPAEPQPGAGLQPAHRLPPADALRRLAVEPRAHPALDALGGDHHPVGRGRGEGRRGGELRLLVHPLRGRVARGPHLAPLQAPDPARRPRPLLPPGHRPGDGAGGLGPARLPLADPGDPGDPAAAHHLRGLGPGELPVGDLDPGRRAEGDLRAAPGSSTSSAPTSARSSTPGWRCGGRW